MHDIIIVGAGTSGCVLAERLTRSGVLRVLLIEAGTAPASPFVRIPAGFTRLFKGRHDWALESEPQRYACNRRVFMPRGKMLGGSANMNGQIHQWCHPQDYADWVDAGASGWGWSDVAPVFRAQECLSGEGDDAIRGRSGPMAVTSNPHAHRLSHAFVAAARSAAAGEQAGYNGRAYEGAWISEIAHRDGRRFSVYDACLLPALGRKNLQVVTAAQVSTVDLREGRACGVTVRAAGATQSYPARAVVLAAGAIGTPQLLQLSGIGPAADLADLGIGVRIDAPEVGANLQDHPVAVSVYRTRGVDTMRRAESLSSMLRYLLLRRGMLASNGIEALAFARSTPDLVAPDIELMTAPLEWRNQALAPPVVDAVSIASAVVAPRSRGRLVLRSAEPGDAPRIDLGLLSDPDGADRRALLAGLRWARRVAAMAPLADYIVEELKPGNAFQNDDALFERACEDLQTVYHPSCTCRMGSDPRSVVDPQLRVRGADGLWIADASVMPTVPRGHPNSVVAMIAQRAGEWIERDFAAA
jgi:choline dehydrogenase